MMSTSKKRNDIFPFSFLTILFVTLVTILPYNKEILATHDNDFGSTKREKQELTFPNHKVINVNNSEQSDLEMPSGRSARFATYDNVEFITDPDLIYAHGNRQAQITEESVYLLDKTSDIETTSIGNNPRINSSFSTVGTSVEEVPKYKNIDTEERPSGAILGKLNTAEAGNTLPIFLTEPESVYVVKNRPAVLKCKAAHALQLHFKCSGSSQPPPSTHDKHVDPHTGVHLEEVTATIHRDLVDEYFGKGPFKCECHAWSSRGVAKSQSATINIAYIRKHFVTSPTSLRIEIGTTAVLHCQPPGGFPEPKVLWYKNNVLLSASSEYGYTISADGTLNFAHVSLQDMANYTCSAENIAGKRISDSAVLIVYVNGGWSSWSTWKECKCSSKQSQGRKRTRTCNNPIPMNGGAQCTGPQIQKSSDCAACSDDAQIVNSDVFDMQSSKRGKWSAWGEWGSCTSECVQSRRRKCISNTIDEDVLSGNVVSIPFIQCSGKDVQTAECRGEYCHIGNDDFDWTLYLGLAFITAVCFAFGLALICCARRNIRTNSHYNMARTVMDSKYIPGVNKKDMAIHVEAVNDSYDYPNSGHRFPIDHIVGCTLSEHHYDVPNLSANYTNPIDELSVDYITDTPDTSTADTSNSTYDVTVNTSPPNISRNAKCETLNNNGGSLSLYQGEMLLHIPEFAIGKSQKKKISLVVLSDDSTCIPMPNTDPLLICSAIVHCAPRNYCFQKPVILKIRHCLIEPKIWNVNIYYADNDDNDINVAWRKIISVGDETINTPVYVQLETSHVYIMTEQLGRFAVVADPKDSCDAEEEPSIKMKLIAFSQLAPSSANYSLRIYVVKDFPNSKDICTGIESQLGGSCMGESDTFAFHLNHCDLNIRVRIANNDSLDSQNAVELHEHTIPYNHILSNSSIMHCEFNIKCSQHNLNSALNLDVDFVQSDGELRTFSISSQSIASSNATPDRQTTVSIDRQGNYVSDTNILGGFQLPRVTKRLICAALDPPRSDERDWRLLARKLNTDHYLAYFATKPSPTEQILNLWECRASSSSHTIVELLNILKEMNREDLMEIISETIGPLWI